MFYPRLAYVPEHKTPTLRGSFARLRQGLKALVLVSMLCLAIMVVSVGLPQGSLADRASLQESHYLTIDSTRLTNLIQSDRDASISRIHQSFISSPRVINLFTSKASLRGQQTALLPFRLLIQYGWKISRGVAHIDAPELLHIQTTNFPLVI